MAVGEPMMPMPGSPIPESPDFPTTWDQPGDERLCWTTDPMHFPGVITPLAASVLGRLYGSGFNRAAEVYGLSLHMRFRRVNAYFYEAIFPIGVPTEPVVNVRNSPPEATAPSVRASQIAAAEKPVGRYVDNMAPVLARLGEYWNDELLPEVKTTLAEWERFDRSGASLDQLVAHLNQMVSRMERLGAIHFLIVLPSLLALSAFDELYRDLCDDDDPFGSYRLLQGYDNKALEADRALWTLGRRAREVPEVRRALETMPIGNALAHFDRSVPGRAFRHELGEYLAVYGRRTDTLDAIGGTAWIEDPTPVLENLKDYLTQPDRDLSTEQATLVATRERAIDEARQRLADHPQSVVEQFAGSLRAAQAAIAIHEDHHYWIDQVAQFQIRRVFQELGRRLAAANVIDSADDIFYLTLDELQMTAAALPGLDRHQLVRDRRAELTRFATVRPPAVLGTLPLGPPPDYPLGRALARLFGAPVPLDPDPKVIRGHAGSPGHVRGPVRVVRRLADAGKVQQGDVLVSETTTPSWTPLFATVGAVVTDTGGILSHGAVVAREYGIPAVVGTARATRVLRDGQLVDVDGANGIVRIVE